MTRILSTFRALRHRHPFEDALAEEMRQHLELRAEDLVRSGLSAEAAARQAKLEFGSALNAATDCREARGLRLFDNLLQDFRQAIRGPKKAPAFTVTALATLAICLGANLTLFAVVDAVLLRPLPFPDSGRLVSVYNAYPKAGVPNDGCSLTNYYERRGKISALSSLAAYRDATAIVGETGAAEREEITRVSPDFFATLGIALPLGRAFQEAETTYQTDKVAILTDAYWRRRFAADPAVLGRQLRVNGVATTVIGILPPTFSFLSSTARLYFPLSSDPAERVPRQRHSGSSWHMIARLAPGASLAQAQTQIDAHNASMERDDPQAKSMADAGFRSIVTPLRAEHVAAIRPILLSTQAGALLLLLIGAVNLVNLLLIRASGRVKEIAVRQALGAGRWHVVRSSLVQTLLLTTVGGALGLALGAAGIRLLSVLGVQQLPLGAHVVLDTRLVVVAALGSLGLGLALAVPIAWYALRGSTGSVGSRGSSNRSAADALRSESRGGTAGRAAQQLRHGFLVAQMALAFVLLAGASLLGLSLERAMAVSPGFQPENVLSGRISLPRNGYPRVPDLLSFTERLVAELRREPGVLTAGVATNVPLSGRSNKSAATVEGWTPGPGEGPHGHYSYGVTGDALGALGFTLRGGRFLTADDSRRAQRVCVVDEDFARRYFPSGGALGRRLFQGGAVGPSTDAFTIVGVVGAAKQAEVTEDAAQGAVFYPFGTMFDRDVFVVVRTSLAPAALSATLRDVVRKLDPELPVSDVRTMQARIADSLVARRSPALLAGVFSAIAILLTAIGTYGVLSFAVAQRRREIGLRMALGARPQQVRRQFVGLAWRLVVVGTLVGGIGAWLAGLAMQGVLFHVPAVHWISLAGTAAILGFVCLFACLLPANRAARLSPMAAIADE
ncbi:MAG: ABC transporter permease [Acidobacteriota bacterium]